MKRYTEFLQHISLMNRTLRTGKFHLWRHLEDFFVFKRILSRHYSKLWEVKEITNKCCVSKDGFRTISSSISLQLSRVFGRELCLDILLFYFFLIFLWFSFWITFQDMSRRMKPMKSCKEDQRQKQSSVVPVPTAVTRLMDAAVVQVSKPVWNSRHYDSAPVQPLLSLPSSRPLCYY